MLFNSINFAIFLPVVFFLYWFVAKKGIRIQNFILLISSYFFYACWDWRFLFLLFFSTVLDYYTGSKIFNTGSFKTKKFWLWLSISINLGILVFFKYCNFFIESFTTAIGNFGFNTNPWTLKIILPVGISFYTFHGLSYVIDIYKSRIKPERNFIDYAVFVSFFPLLVAGPIERATHLLPQIKNKRIFDYTNAVDGLRQILWGLFKKIVIADQCGKYANIIFNNSADCSGSTLLLGALFFAFQIYGDFSGYSDIALGTARLFGIKVLRNFSFPYFSRDIAEFWRRWHISLSSWFRDYLYIPIGGSRGSTLMTLRNVFIVFIITGFWHGANWTFIFWGLLNALYITPLIILKVNRRNIETVAKGRIFPSIKEGISIVVTFILTCFAWIFFRAEDLRHAFEYVSQIFSASFFSVPVVKPKVTFLLLVFFIIIEWVGREDEYAIETLGKNWNVMFRWAFYILLVTVILFLYKANQSFIYFQF